MNSFLYVYYRLRSGQPPPSRGGPATPLIAFIFFKEK